MSYIRFGERDSDVYVYLDVAGGIECCGCALDDCYHAGTAAQMAEHLREHLAAGHTVPDGVIDAVLANPELDPLRDRPTSIYIARSTTFPGATIVPRESSDTTP